MHFTQMIVGNQQIRESAFHSSYVREMNQGDKVFDFSDYPEENKCRLYVSTINAHAIYDEVLKGEFSVIDMIPTGQYVEFNRSTKEITFNDLTPDFIINIIDGGQRIDPGSDAAAWTFIMQVLRNKNLFVYTMFATPREGLFDIPRIIGNIMKHIENVEIFEKIAKVNGEQLLFKNIGSPNFSLNASAKKLRKAIGVPDEVKQYMKTSKMEHLLPSFQKFSVIPNDGKDFVTYLKFLKKCGVWSRWEGERFINNLSKLVDMTDAPFRTILNHLIRENWFFSNFGIPENESRRWIDCIDMAKAAGLELPKTFQNITKYHSILAKNVDVLNNPRTEEFAEAVSLYSRLTKELDGYIIRPPKDEYELVEEGVMLHHCVASYRDKIIDNHAIVLLCRKVEEPNTPLYTIELEYTPGDTSFAVSQFKQIYDADVTDTKMRKLLAEYLDSRRYLIEGGKNLFVKPKVRKPKKGEEENNDEV